MKDKIVEVLKAAGIRVFSSQEVKLNDEDVKIELIVENRGTGKTFRRILRALLKASEGNYVFFISRTDEVAYHNLKTMQRIAEVYGIRDIQVEMSSKRLKIADAGTIKVVSESYFVDNPEVVRGLKAYEEIWDI